MKTANEWSDELNTTVSVRSIWPEDVEQIQLDAYNSAIEDSLGKIKTQEQCGYKGEHYKAILTLKKEKVC